MLGVEDGDLLGVLLGVIDGDKDCVGTVEPACVGELLGFIDGNKDNVGDLLGFEDGNSLGL